MMDETLSNAIDGGMAGAMAASMDRLATAAGLLEKAVMLLEERHAAMTGDVARIVATVESAQTVEQSESNQRQAELERKLRQAEEQIAELRAQAAMAAPAAASTPAAGSAPTAGSARKTLPLATTQLLAKQGVHSVDGLEAGALDAALTGLSMEQRIAVKAQLIRTGALA
jgi:hypothetical protein